jgi:hypothetical protein
LNKLIKVDAESIEPFFAVGFSAASIHVEGQEPRGCIRQITDSRHSNPPDAASVFEDED